MKSNKGKAPAKRPLVVGPTDGPVQMQAMLAAPEGGLQIASATISKRPRLDEEITEELPKKIVINDDLPSDAEDDPPQGEESTQSEDDTPQEERLYIRAAGRVHQNLAQDSHYLALRIDEKYVLATPYLFEGKIYVTIKGEDGEKETLLIDKLGTDFLLHKSRRDGVEKGRVQFVTLASLGPNDKCTLVNLAPIVYENNIPIVDAYYKVYVGQTVQLNVNFLQFPQNWSKEERFLLSEAFRTASAPFKVVLQAANYDLEFPVFAEIYGIEVKSLAAFGRMSMGLQHVLDYAHATEEAARLVMASFQTRELAGVERPPAAKLIGTVRLGANPPAPSASHK